MDGAEIYRAEWRLKENVKGNARLVKEAAKKATWAVFSSAVPPYVAHRQEIAFRGAFNTPSPILGLSRARSANTKAGRRGSRPDRRKYRSWC